MYLVFKIPSLYEFIVTRGKSRYYFRDILSLWRKFDEPYPFDTKNIENYPGDERNVDPFNEEVAVHHQLYDEKSWHLD